MNSTKKKIAYGLLTLLGLGAFIVILVRATYDTSFLTFGSGGDAAPIVEASTGPVATLQGVPPATQARMTAHAAGQANAAPAPHAAAYGRISIPSIGVDAVIENVGLTYAGNMGTPKKLADTGWYKYGTAPGDVGSAVIDGHVENSLGMPGVFYKLHAVQAGDDVYVTGQDGTRLHFVVQKVSDYSVSDAPTDAIFNDTSGQRILNLITCRKTIIGGRAHYDNRTVVTAVLAA